MGRPATLLEGLCGHALSMGADCIEVEYRDGCEWVYAKSGCTSVSIAHYKSSGADAKELREDLAVAVRKQVRLVVEGKVYILKVRAYDSFGENAWEVSMKPAPKPDASKAPSFTAKQGQYLAFIYNYTKMHHGQAPSELDLQGYFQVSAPSIHNMVKTLERNCLIEKKPGQARSIRLLVSPEHLPRLE